MPPWLFSLTCSLVIDPTGLRSSIILPRYNAVQHGKQDERYKACNPHDRVSGGYLFVALAWSLKTAWPCLPSRRKHQRMVITPDMQRHNIAPISLIVKIGDDVPMPFKDVHYLKAVINIPEEDHIGFVRHAAQVRVEVGAWRVPAYRVKRPACDSTHATPGRSVAPQIRCRSCGDIAQNPDQIVLNRGEENRAPHTPIPWRRSTLLWRAKAS